MGSRKRNTAEQRKEANKTAYFAKLNDCPTSPRKMRLVADQIRGKDVDIALQILKHSPKEASRNLYKLVKSAIANWETKTERTLNETEQVYVKKVFVDSGRSLKRIQPAPQGRAHRIRKRSNHVTVYLASRLEEQQLGQEEMIEENNNEE